MKRLKAKTSFLYFSIILLSIASTVNAQQTTWNSKQAYLGQLPPGDTPKIFAPGLLKDSGIILGRVAFSKDGSTFYYGYGRHWFDGSGIGIKTIGFDGTKWGRPKIIIEGFSTPTLFADDHKLFLAGKNSAVYMSEEQNGAWSKPVVFLDIPAHGLYNFMPTNSGLYYVGANPVAGKKNDYSTFDFCTLSINGNDTIIKSLGAPLNTPAFDGDFYIAPDESYIIISAKETKTYECELWISFRKKDHSWTNPKSLGPLINTGLAHRFGQYVSPDGKYLFYTKGTGEKDCNFYWVRFDKLLKKLKPKE